MLIFVAIALLLLLSSPWNVVAFLVLLPLWVLELFGWNRTTKRHKKAVGRDVDRARGRRLPPVPAGRAGAARRRDLGGAL
jgi:hypothetical protein